MIIRPMNINFRVNSSPFVSSHGFGSGGGLNVKNAVARPVKSTERAGERG